MATEPTPKDTLFRDGTAKLYHFRSNTQAPPGPVVLLVPSMINRWYVLDLHEGASVARAFVEAGFDTYCLDWGVPEDEDRYLDWDSVLDRLGRMVRRVRRITGQDKIGILGYCMGATLSGIWTALHPEQVAAFVNLAGPFDFSEAGMLGDLTNPEWFDAAAITSAGNVSPKQMQDGFLSLRPTSQLGKWVSYASRFEDPNFRKAFKALDTWAEDNIPFPGAAYVTYIEDLYQKNLLVKGEHYAQGRRVDLGQITCPVLTIATSRDHICPSPAAKGLHDNVGAEDKEMIVVRGGHVGAVVGSRASRELYPQITEWFAARLHRQEAGAPAIKVVDEPSATTEAPPQPSVMADEEWLADDVAKLVASAIESGRKTDLVDALEAIGLDPEAFSNNTQRSAALDEWQAKRS